MYVGSYGYTDVHLRLRATRNNAIMNYKPETMLCALNPSNNSHLKSYLPVLHKDISVNQVLFEKKKKGKMQWNNTILRFNWHFDCPSEHASDIVKASYNSYSTSQHHVPSPLNVITHFSLQYNHTAAIERADYELNQFQYMTAISHYWCMEKGYIDDNKDGDIFEC
jgi:bisphosphoglycerate-independent phosphoglycerate mutase (AlkP superfamily)